MCRLRELTIKEKNYLIDNNLDPKDFMFHGLVEGGITFYNKHFKNLWTITKRTYLTDQSRVMSKAYIFSISERM